MNDKNNKYNLIVFLVSSILLAVLFCVSLVVGKYSLTINRVFSIFTGNASELDKKVFTVLRLPRTAMAIIAGIALGLSGCTYQIMFKNPLASPDLIGVASGANLGAAIAIVSVSSGIVAVSLGSFLGGIISALLVIAASKVIGNYSTSVYIMVGIIINAITSSGIMALKYFADPAHQLATIEYWEMGTLGNITLNKFLVILPVFIVAFVLEILLARQIELSALNDNESRSLGVRVKTFRIIILLVNTLMVSSVVCMTGLITFVGLIAPHVSRAILKKSGKTALFLSGIIGAIVVLLSDIIVRSVYAAELPISIITSVIVIPVLVLFLIKRKGVVR